MTAHSALCGEEMVPQDIDSFLMDIEKKAYRMALMTVGGHADAIDLVQDSMFKLVINYANKPPQEWKPLFYKILQNRIRDWQRQQKLKNVLFFWKSTDEDEQVDEWPVATSKEKEGPEQVLSASRQQDFVLQEIADLSEKQRQCFLLRSWEGLSVIETASIMGCSQGSVKTHYFRAVSKLRAALGDVYDIKI